MDGITCSTPLRKWVGEEIRARCRTLGFLPPAAFFQRKRGAGSVMIVSAFKRSRARGTSCVSNEWRWDFKRVFGQQPYHGDPDRTHCSRGAGYSAIERLYAPISCCS